jgi:hypothetical protein
LIDHNACPFRIGLIFWPDLFIKKKGGKASLTSKAPSILWVGGIIPIAIGTPTFRFALRIYPRRTADGWWSRLYFARSIVVSYFLFLLIPIFIG